jgi:hypothetical protein
MDGRLSPDAALTMPAPARFVNTNKTYNVPVALW